MHIDLNSDLGESFGHWTIGQDEAMLQVVSSANIACGFHAGDPSVMRKTVQLAKINSVSIGAHPGYADLRGFGRIDLNLPLATIRDDVLYQLGALAAICKAEGTGLAYVKPHGALYNRMVKDKAVAQAVVEAVASFDQKLPLLVLAGSWVEEEATELGLPFKREAFIDRAYLANGQLQSRLEPGSVIQDAHLAAERALQLVETGMLPAIDGTVLRLKPDSLCIHGDTPAALSMAKAVRVRLEQAGIEIRPFIG